MARFNCLVHKEPSNRAICVDVDVALQVEDLKQAICNEANRGWRTPDITLWKVSIPVNEDFVDAVRNFEFQENEEVQELNPMLLLSDYYQIPPEPKHLHIIIQPHKKIEAERHVRGTKRRAGEELDSDDRHARIKLEEQQQSIVEYANRAFPPSSQSKLAPFITEQKKHGYILNNRYVIENDALANDTNGLPVILFNEVFTDFKAALKKKDFEPTDEESRLVDRLSCAASILYPIEEERSLAIKPILSELIDAPLITMTSIGKAQSDGVVITNRGHHVAIRAVLEMRNEIGTGGCDPSIQGACSYRHYWSSTAAGKIRELCCCPSFIIALAGPWMCILGAVFGQNVIVQQLTNYIYLGGDPNSENPMSEIVMVFRALSAGLKTLDVYYSALQVKSGPLYSRFFPYPRVFPVDSGPIQFEYLKKLVPEKPLRAIYKAKITGTGKLVVVKFARQYNVAAHHLLASRQLAPNLLSPSRDGHPCQFGPFKMIVMEFTNSCNVHEYRCQGGQLPNCFHEQVEEAIKILHGNGWVFGDLRTPNIMVHNDRPLLVDFDWCGKDGVGTYPSDLNEDDNIGWHPDVGRGRIMRKEHDLFMLEKLSQELHVG
ncbi:hypothetical protein FRC02_000790 [Tulasnella sp. 418]|nr:hypothetical protein FRC02_000790 [Tulasnella sp. 418]